MGVSIVGMWRLSGVRTIFAWPGTRKGCHYPPMAQRGIQGWCQAHFPLPNLYGHPGSGRSGTWSKRKSMASLWHFALYFLLYG